MKRQVPVTFSNRKGEQLFGILHRVEEGVAAHDAAVVLLSPGSKSRVAPHRLYVKMARRFAAMGFAVFRFDPEGIGDSEGEISEKLTADFFASVQYGRYVESTLDALDWVNKELGISRFIAGGLCGGAITGLLAAAQDDRIVSLLGLGIPAVSSAITMTDPYRYISKGQLEGLKKGYLQNLLSLKRWWRLLTFQSDYRMISKVLFSSVAKKGANQEVAGTAGNGQDAETSNLNPLFVDGMFAMLESGREMCLIFSENDRLYWEFEEKFRHLHRDRFDSHKDRCEVHVVAGANHIFSFSEWEQDMMSKACRWLEKQAVSAVASA